MHLHSVSHPERLCASCLRHAIPRQEQPLLKGIIVWVNDSVSLYRLGLSFAGWPACHLNSMLRSSQDAVASIFWEHFYNAVLPSCQKMHLHICQQQESPHNACVHLLVWLDSQTPGENFWKGIVFQQSTLHLTKEGTVVTYISVKTCTIKTLEMATEAWDHAGYLFMSLWSTQVSSIISVLTVVWYLCRPVLVVDIFQCCGLERAVAGVDASLQAIIQMSASPELQVRTDSSQ